MQVVRVLSDAAPIEFKVRKPPETIEIADLRVLNVSGVQSRLWPLPAVLEGAFDGRDGQAGGIKAQSFHRLLQS